MDTLAIILNRVSAIENDMAFNSICSAIAAGMAIIIYVTIVMRKDKKEGQ